MFSKVWDLIFKTILFQDFFLMFSVLSFRMEHKKAIENWTSVYFCLHREFYTKKKCLFWGILLLCSLVSNTFFFFRGSEVCLERCYSYGIFGFFKKIKKKNTLYSYCKPGSAPLHIHSAAIGELILPYQPQCYSSKWLQFSIYSWHPLE